VCTHTSTRVVGLASNLCMIHQAAATTASLAKKYEANITVVGMIFILKRCICLLFLSHCSI
jgi:hypothetical protein